jgi:hypothetical protein
MKAVDETYEEGRCPVAGFRRLGQTVAGWWSYVGSFGEDFFSATTTEHLRRNDRRRAKEMAAVVRRGFETETHDGLTKHLPRKPTHVRR